MREIKSMTPQATFPAGEFIDRCEDGTFKSKDFDKEGPLLALKWAFAREEEAVDQDDEKMKVDIFQGDESDDWLFQIDWDESHVRALMRPIDPAELGQKLPDMQKKEWMPHDRAMQIFVDLSVSDLVGMCAGLSTGDNVVEDDDVDVEVTED